MTRPTTPKPSTPLLDILTRTDDTGRSECLLPVDDDWKERMRALNPNRQAEPGDKQPPEG